MNCLGTLKWNFRLGDPEWGITQASNLVAALEKALAHHNVSVGLHKASVEVMPKGLNSGVGLRLILNDYLEKSKGVSPDLVLCKYCCCYKFFYILFLFF